MCIRDRLKKAGINLDIELVEHATFHAQIRKDLSPIVHYQAGRFPVADVYLTQFFDSRSTIGTPTAVTNFSHCSLADEEILSPIVHYQAGRFPVADVYLTQFFDSRSTIGTPTAVTNFSHCSLADEEIL